MNREEVLTKWGEPQKVGTDGFVRLVDYMGGDDAIVQAARTSYGKGTKKVNEDRNLIRYLLRHRHTTPFEMVTLKFHVRVPMDTWRQWIRHRTASVNEYSTRYSEAIDSRETASAWRLQSKSNKQGSAGTLGSNKQKQCMCLPHENLRRLGRQYGREAFVELAESNASIGHWMREEIPKHWEKATFGEVWDDLKAFELSRDESRLHKLSGEVYQRRLDAGIAREQARKDLPLSTYTEAYWKMDLHNLFHFLRLRMHPHAQQEIREFAEIIFEMVKDVVPVAAEAFEDYALGGRFFTSEEMSALRAMLNGAMGSWQDEHGNPDGPVGINDLLPERRQEILQKYISTKRERIEFWKKLHG